VNLFQRDRITGWFCTSAESCWHDYASGKPEKGKAFFWMRPKKKTLVWTYRGSMCFFPAQQIIGAQ